jgi:hypothetical protein
VRLRIRRPYLVIGLVAFGPLLVSLGAGAVATALGCRLDEGQPHPCVFGGTDLGSTLYTLGVLGWLSLASIPLGLILLAGYIGYSFLKRARRSRSNTA